MKFRIYNDKSMGERRWNVWMGCVILAKDNVVRLGV
jgi:hypothetical protein